MSPAKPSGAAFSSGIASILEKGSCKGLLVRGGHEVDLYWENGNLSLAVVRPKFHGAITVIGKELSVTCKGKAVTVNRTENGFSFEAFAEEEYELKP